MPSRATSTEFQLHEKKRTLGKTFGVITMVGDKQAEIVDNMLRAQLEPAVYEQRRILCGNPAQFQGDERDVIFLTLVDSKEDSLGPMVLRQDGADGMWKKRFNVAASRAKDLNRTDFPGGSFT